MISVKRITIASMFALASLAACPAITETPKGVERIIEVMNSAPKEDEFVHQHVVTNENSKKTNVPQLLLAIDAFVFGAIAAVGMIMKKTKENNRYT